MIVADEAYRGGKCVPLKRTMDTALKICPSVETVFVAERTGGTIFLNDNEMLLHEVEISWDFFVSFV